MLHYKLFIYLKSTILATAIHSNIQNRECTILMCQSGGITSDWTSVGQEEREGGREKQRMEIDGRE